MEMEKGLLLRYGLEAERIEQVTGYLFKVKCGNRNYALKKRTVSMEDERLWTVLHHQAALGIMRGVLPVYMTIDGLASVHMNEDVYYLMPWIDSDRPEADLLLGTIGHIHMKTKRIAAPDCTPWIESIRTCRENIGSARKILLQYIERFENRQYMSPFELSCCTQYMEADRACAEQFRLLEKMEKLLEQGNDWHEYTVHGRLAGEHFLNGTTPFFINWEKTHYGNATVDLHAYFSSEMRHSANFVQRDHYLSAFDGYMKTNCLSELEICQLSITLLDPMPYLQWIEHIAESNTRVSMLGAIRILNAHFRILMFGLAFVHYCNEKQGMRGLRSDPAQIEREEEAGYEAEKQNVQSRRQEQSTNDLEE